MSFQESTRPERAPRHVAGRPAVRLDVARDTARRWLARITPTQLALAAALLIAVLFTGVNMLHYPQFESDEGTYMGSAWAMMTQDKLSYYTYTYDHPPLGWLQIGLWSELTGGFDAFGMAVDSGRALMLVVTVVSTLLVFQITRRATGRTAAALFAAVIFAVSPLAVSLHRQVWLDNLATLWLLVSLYLLVSGRERLGRIVLSGIAFGVAFWTKEVFVAFVPGLLLLAWSAAHPAQRRFATALWGAIAAAAVSLFLLLATLKNELLPPGVLGRSGEHVSLVDTYLYQASRGGDGSIFTSGSQFWHFAGQWVDAAPLLAALGGAATLAGLFMWRRERLLFCLSVMTIVFVLFLGRGGVVLTYYVVPLIALLSLSAGVTVGYLLNRLPRPAVTPRAAATIVVVLTLLLVQHAVGANAVNFQTDSTSSQRVAARWIADNVARDTTIIMDSYLWTDLRMSSFTNGDPFPNAHYYWPALQDPAVRGGVLHDDWRTIDYLAFSPSTEADLERGFLPLVDDALEHADVVQLFPSGEWSIKLLRVRHVQQREATADPMLRRSWETYRRDFIEDGRVRDLSAGGRTTSEGQAYALLRSVYMDDRSTFDAVWQWTVANLQTRDDALLSWLFDDDRVVDAASASDADQDAALALLFASRRWDEPAYEREALRILADIWAHETVEVAGRRTLVAGDWATGESASVDNQVIINPSYFAPYAARIFAEADPSHPWMEIVDSSYDVLGRIAASDALGGTRGMVPDWAALDPATGEVRPADLGDRETTTFSFDASRVPTRLALDWLWFKDERARQALAAIHFPADALNSEGRLSASYHADGTPAADFESTSVYAGVVPGLLLSDQPDLAHKTFTEQVLRSYVSTDDGAWWGYAHDNYFDQNTAWFTAAIMNGAMSNLWAGQTTIDWDSVLPGQR